MAYYESVFIARQDLSSTQAEGLADTFQKVIEDQGGKVTKRESWGLRNLAYKVKKNRKGHYVMLKVEAPSNALLEMERNMRINEDVLRYMSVRVDELDTQPSAILQNKDRGGRDGRDDRGPRRPRGGDASSSDGGSPSDKASSGSQA